MTPHEILVQVAIWTNVVLWVPIAFSLALGSPAEWLAGSFHRPPGPGLKARVGSLVQKMKPKPRHGKTD